MCGDFNIGKNVLPERYVKYLYGNDAGWANYIGALQTEYYDMLKLVRCGERLNVVDAWERDNIEGKEPVDDDRDKKPKLYPLCPYESTKCVTIADTEYSETNEGEVLPMETFLTDHCDFLHE